MNIKTSLAGLAIAVSAVCISPLATAGLGIDTAAAMTKYYSDTRAYCQSTSAPAFMCSGILLRATVPASTYHSWNPSPRSVANGGVSFSYLRADATFSKLAYGHNNGFTLTPYNDAPKSTIEPEVLCAYPIDAATDDRQSQGCGDSVRTQEQENYCQALGITTAELWANAYFAANQNNSRQCSFDTHENNKAIQGASAFYESIRAMSMIKELPATTQNELRLATWDQNQPLPIQSFFYTTDGLADAQADQADWFKTNGAYVPIIAITLPSATGATATFAYKEEDQAICESYIQSASWQKRQDPGVNKDVWSLMVTPTVCGRKVRENQTNAAYAELVKKYGNSPEWLEQDGGGMRRQLVCHYVLARNKPTWNLEPFRPNVTQEQALADGCNSIAGLNTPDIINPDDTTDPGDTTIPTETTGPTTPTDNPPPINPTGNLNEIGPATAASLLDRYSNKPENCGSASVPAYVCSGILMRTEVLIPPFHAGDIVPENKIPNGGTTFAYLRSDSKFHNMEGTLRSGFILKSATQITLDQINPEVLCFFPSVSNSHKRLQQGCGVFLDPTFKNMAVCQDKNVTTAAQWIPSIYDSIAATYPATTASVQFANDTRINKWTWGCGFDVRAWLKDRSTNAFNEVIKLRAQLNNAFELQNTVRIAAWPLNIGKLLPIEAFFYLTPEAKANAQNEQKDFFNQTGQRIPVVSITLPATPADDAAFLYFPADQVVQ